MKRKQQSAFANPVLIGAVTVLVALVAVFLAYNANSGLPFVPTRELKVDISNGSALVAGNDVREGGYLVGLISDLKPVTMANGQTGAQLTLKLDKAYGDVPVDSTISIQPRSVLGLKYLDLHKGVSHRYFADGGTMPESQTNVPVQFDDVFKAFNTPTRGAIQTNLVGFGDTLASRGSALNDTIASLPPLFGHLEPVARYLSDPSTELTRFFTGLNAFMGAVAPVAQVNAQLFGKMATTFGAIDRNPADLKATIAESPSTEQVSTQSLIAQQPLLTDLTTFGRYMTPATHSLEVALPVLNPALEQGTQVLGRTPPLNQRLQQTMNALRTLAQAPGTNVGLNALVDTVSTLNPMVKYLGPYQTVCDDWNYWWTYIADHFSEATAFGFAQRALLMQNNSFQNNSLSNQGANAPMNGGAFDSPQGGNGYSHGQVYGAAIDNQGNADCETGQRGYVKQLNHQDPQHRNFATDPHNPGDQGTTYNGLTKVPAGETFSRAPEIGPQLPSIPQNP
jgi:phospholipid/cholesterol/gamma-HCH transport system substrate-binding protein